MSQLLSGYVYALKGEDLAMNDPDHCRFVIEGHFSS